MPPLRLTAWILPLIFATQVHAAWCPEWLAKVFRGPAPIGEEFSSDLRERLISDSVSAYLGALVEKKAPRESLLGFTIETKQRELIDIIASRHQEAISSFLNRHAHRSQTMGTEEEQKAWVEEQVKASLLKLRDDLEFARAAYVTHLVQPHINGSQRALDTQLNRIIREHEAEFPHAAKLVRDTVGRVSSDLAHQMLGYVIGRVRDRVDNTEIHQPLAIKLQNLEQWADERVMREFLWAQAEEIAKRIARDAIPGLKTVASQKRSDAQTGGVFSRGIHRIHRMEARDFSEEIAEEIQRAVVRPHTDARWHFAKLDEIASRNGNYYWDKTFQKLVYDVTQVTLDKVAAEAAREAVKATIKALRKVDKTDPRKAELKELAGKPQTLKTMLGPKIAEFERRVWLLTPEERDKGIEQLASSIITEIPLNHVLGLAERYQRRFSRQTATEEIEAKHPELRTLFEKAVERRLAERGEVVTQDEALLLDAVRTGELRSTGFEEHFDRELVAVVEMHRLARDSEKIPRFFEAHLTDGKIDYLIRHHLIPWVKGRALAGDIPPLGNATQKVMRLLDAHARRVQAEARKRSDIRGWMIANRAIAELSRNRVEDFDWALQESVGVLIEKGDVSPENIEHFIEAPERFLKIEDFYRELFAQADGGNQGVSIDSTARYMYGKLPPIPDNSLAIARHGYSFLMSVGRITDPSLKEAFELALRTDIQDFLYHGQSGCAKGACDNLDTDAYTIPIHEVLALKERFIDGTGRGSENQFHFNGSNRVPARQYLALISIGFFKNELERYPIPSEVSAFLKSSEKPRYILSGDRRALVDQQVHEFWREIEKRNRQALSRGDITSAFALQLVHHNMPNAYRDRLVSDLQSTGGGPNVEAGIQHVRNDVQHVVRETVAKLDELGDRLAAAPGGRRAVAFLETSPGRWGMLMHAPESKRRWYFPIPNPAVADQLKARLVETADGWQLPAEAVPAKGMKPEYWLASRLEIDPGSPEIPKAFTLPKPGWRHRWGRIWNSLFRRRSTGVRADFQAEDGIEFMDPAPSAPSNATPGTGASDDDVMIIQ